MLAATIHGGWFDDLDAPVERSPLPDAKNLELAAPPQGLAGGGTF